MILRTTPETTELPDITVASEFGDLVATCGRWQAKLLDSGTAYSLALASPGGAWTYLAAKDLANRTSVRVKVFSECGEYLDDHDLDSLLGSRVGKAWRRGILPQMLDVLRKAEEAEE